MFWIFYIFVQYLHLVFFIFVFLHNIVIFRFRFSIYLCSTLIIHGLTFIHNVNSCFVFLVLDVVALPLIAIEGVH